MQVMTAVGERDAAVAEAEQRAGDALREMTRSRALTLREAVEWCGERSACGRRRGCGGWPSDDQDAATGRRERGRRRPTRPRVGERVPVRRLDDAGLAAVAAAIADPAVLARYRAKVATVPGSECLWWTGAVAGRSERERTDGGGHGRFWYAPGRVIIAHRFAFAVMNGVDALAQARLLGHRCHNPLCQRIAPDHVVVSSAAQNRREWAVQRRLPYSPLADPRGPRRRARELRDLAREDPQLVADDLARLQELLGEQLTLW